MKQNQKKGSILVIDDEVQVCKVIQKVLAQEGYRIFSTTSGEEALKQLKKMRVDLVLVDLKMPTMDGLELLKRAKIIQKNLKVIILTAYGTVSSAREAMILGVFDFITKPFDNKLLKQVVREALDAKR